MKMIEKVRRKNTLLQFGFGVEVMKTTTVCTNCKSMGSVTDELCSKCGSKLPGATLYDYYRAQHSCCSKCGTVLSESMDYCTKCGIPIKKAE